MARDGTASDFITPGAHGYLAGLGVAVDAQRRRLWAVSTAQADDGLFDAATVATSAVHVFDLDTGSLLWRHVTAQRDEPSASTMSACCRTAVARWRFPTVARCFASGPTAARPWR
ncbi:MAG: hypothetical protein IPO18_08525 [bacterium]|nr:hypothetical protein [bacterium]